MIAILQKKLLKVIWKTPIEILNWYRNLYYTEPSNTERGIMANAINDLFMKYKDEFR